MSLNEYDFGAPDVERKPCRVCGSVYLDVHYSRREYWVQCDDCGHAGHVCDSEELCIAAWNEDRCDKAPADWRCTRDPGHPGPCAAELNKGKGG